MAQVAATAALTGSLDDVNVMRTAFDERRLTIHRMLNEIEGVECLEPQGAFYAFPSLQGLIGRKIANRQVDSTLDLATIVLEEANVAFVPGEAFGAPGSLDIGEGFNMFNSFWRGRDHFEEIVLCN